MIISQVTGSRMPLLVILELTLHFIEVHVEVFFISSRCSKMGIDAGVVATLKADTSCILGIVELLVEVRDSLIGLLTGFHTVLKHDTSSCFLV